MPLPNVISISYGVCEASVKPYTAARTLFDRQAGRDVRAGDHDRRRGRRQRLVGVRPRRADLAADSFDKQKSASWPATSPWVLAVGGTNLTLTPANAIESSGVWNDTEYPPPYTQTAGGRWRRQHVREAPVVAAGDLVAERPTGWSPTSPRSRTPSPGYAIICSPGVQGCGPSPGQTITFVGGTSAAAPLVAGMIALWDQQAQQSGLPKPGFVPPLLYSIAQHAPGSFLDITAGSNAVFSGVSCCSGGHRATTWRRGSARRSPTRSFSTCITDGRVEPRLDSAVEGAAWSSVSTFR